MLRIFLIHKELCELLKKRLMVMATEDSYEIMPYKEIIELKNKISELQKKTGDTSSKELIDSMVALTKSMDSMLRLFSSAAEEMKLEEKSEGELAEKIGPLIEKVDKLDEQNRTIAEGLVAVANMVKDLREGEKEEKPRIIRRQKIRAEAPQEPEEEPMLPPLEPQSPFEPSDEEEGLPPLEPPEMNAPFSAGSPRVIPNRQMPPPGMFPRRPMPPPGMMPRGPMPPPGMMPRGPMPPPFMGSPEEPDFGPLPPLEEEPRKKGLMGMFKKK